MTHYPPVEGFTRARSSATAREPSSLCGLVKVCFISLEHASCPSCINIAKKHPQLINRMRAAAALAKAS